LLGQIGQRGLYVGNLVRPKGVTVDSDGNIYVVESYYDHLLIYDEDGKFLVPIGGTGSEAGQFFLPAGMWSDKNDRIFVADMFNSRVVIFRYVGTGK
jgi:DNA-binding beta-propeller fold protein YncE